MTAHKLSCIILAAGSGTRMKSALPKPLHPVAGRAMVNHVIAAAEGLNPDKIVVVVSPTSAGLAEAVRPHAIAVQEEVNGTGGAVKAARDHFKGYDGDILILFGDSPLITTATLRRVVDIRRQFPAMGLAYCGARREDPAAYGRMVKDEDGTLKKIVEFRDASPEEKKIDLVNAGIVCADGAQLFGWLDQVKNDNAAKEFYLTDLPPIARKDNRTTHIVEIPAEEMEGANTRAELAKLEKLMQRRLREKHMLNGATLTDPDTVYFSFDTVLGQDVTVGPGVVFGPGVTVANGAEILPFCHIEGAEIGEGAKVGPFARLRPGTKVGVKAKIGNFVETKNTALGAGAKANHLTYLGDADVGEKANIGAGTITCNYDGFDKRKTKIGREAFVGSNTSLIAPVVIGDGAYVGAGSAIAKDVPANALGVSRPQQSNLDGWAETFRNKKKKEKQ